MTTEYKRALVKDEKGEFYYRITMDGREQVGITPKMLPSVCFIPAGTKMWRNILRGRVIKKECLGSRFNDRTEIFRQQGYEVEVLK